MKSIPKSSLLVINYLFYKLPMMRVIISITLFTISIISWAEASEAKKNSPINLSGGFKETILTEVKTYGYFVVGIEVNEKNPRANPVELKVLLPETSKQRMCVFIRSIDALYSAEAEFDISKATPGIWSLGFAPNEPAYFNYRPGEIAVDTRIANNCDVLSDTIQIGSLLSIDKELHPMLTLYINSDGNDAFLVLPDANNQKDLKIIDCESIKSTRVRRTYSLACRINNVKSYDLSGGWLELRSYGEYVASEPLRIQLPEESN